MGAAMQPAAGNPGKRAQFDPVPFVAILTMHGLPWTAEELPGPVEF